MVAFEVATPLDLRFFLHVFMYPFFFLSFGIYIQSPFPPKKQLSKDFQTILSGHKSCSFFFLKEISRGPGRSKSLEENDRIRSEADSGGSDSETCTG